MKIVTKRNHKIIMWIGKISSILIIPLAIINKDSHIAIMGGLLCFLFWVLLPDELYYHD